MSSMATAQYWVMQVMAVSLQMALPVLLGGVADAWLGLSPVLMLVGIVCGLALGVWRLVSLKAPSDSSNDESELK